MIVGVVGWLVSVVVFIVAVDYIGSRIDRVGVETAHVREVLDRIDSCLCGYVRGDPHEKSDRELQELHKTVLGGLTALIAIANLSPGVDRKKLTVEPARETLTDFVSEYTGWREIVTWELEMEERTGDDLPPTET